MTTTEMFVSLKWQPIFDLVQQQKLVTVFKSINGLYPNYLKELFAEKTQTNRQLRSSTSLSIQNPVSSFRALQEISLLFWPFTLEQSTSRFKMCFLSTKLQFSLSKIYQSTAVHNSAVTNNITCNIFLFIYLWGGGGGLYIINYNM